MKKKLLVRGPALSRSGYGEHCRFLLRSLREYSEYFEIFLFNTNWGQTNWLHEDNEERRWLDGIIGKTSAYLQHCKTINQNPDFDMSAQVTIPNEWEKYAPVNIGVTAGIETTQVAPEWLQKANIMDKIIVVSNHAKEIFERTVYETENKGTKESGPNLTCEVPIEVIHYPVKNILLEETNIDLENDFNFLTVAQWGPRKNLNNTIRWFVEEFIDINVGLIVKVSIARNNITDRSFAKKRLENILNDYPNRKCKVYLLHGNMSEGEMASLYKHPKIKALISLSHGEGFGLPLFEAAYSGMPVISTEWSGQIDFLTAPVKDKKGKVKNKNLFADVKFSIMPIQTEAVWEGVLQAESSWAYADQGSYKITLREIYKDYGRFKKQAKTLQKHILENFEQNGQYKKFVQAILGQDVKKINIEEIPKVSIITSVYNGDEYIRPFLEDITRQTIFEDKCELVIINANSPGNEEEVILEYKEKYPDNIVYRRLEEDPGIYGVWNMGVEMASGEYLTNANLDDRKAPWALELHAKSLYMNESIDLVYADMFITDQPNETWEVNSAKDRRYNFPEFSYENLKMANMPHASPMWRRQIHEKYGFFDAKYRSAGDWEMWLRAASQGSKFKKIDGALGLYYFNPTGISTNPDNFSWKQEEESEIYEKYAEK